ncbi:MAG: phosphatase PAP2 family protein [Dehalococcoidia bacterium]
MVSRPESSESKALGPARWRLSRVTGEQFLLAAQVLALGAMTVIVVTKYWQDHPVIGLALLAVAAGIWLPEARRARMRRWWFGYVAGIFAYTLLRSYADETAIPTRTDYVINLDQFFFGTNPVVWLQSRFFRPGDVSALDLFTVQVHWSFFIAPHAAAVMIFLWRRELFPRYATVVVGTMYAGLLLFFLLPTTPPWLAANLGQLEAFRVMDFVGNRVSPGTYQDFYASLGEPNSVAAMPSIHMGVTFAMYLWSRDHARRWAWPLLAYTALMGFSLVYLAEHYVADLVVGMVCALLCHLASRRLAQRGAEARVTVRS